MLMLCSCVLKDRGTVYFALHGILANPYSRDSSFHVQGLEEGSFDVVVVANLCHIAPWECTVGLCKGVLPI